MVAKRNRSHIIFQIHQGCHLPSWHMWHPRSLQDKTRSESRLFQCFISNSLPQHAKLHLLPRFRGNQHMSNMLLPTHLFQALHYVACHPPVKWTGYCWWQVERRSICRGCHFCVANQSRMRILSSLSLPHFSPHFKPTVFLQNNFHHFTMSSRHPPLHVISDQVAHLKMSAG